MKYYNKLVRDRIPEIMEEHGKKYEIRTLDQEEYIEMLHQKLYEELREFDAASEENQLLELVDMVEVIYALVKSKGYGIDDFESLRIAKKEKRGGFKEKIFLISGEE
ncbi:phosphoribosyl-ATP pyrophosphohydrolase [Paenibacillus polymyxa]|uniref:nucleoside triphosphate pyrophosphohydrolase n=1 Tax=Paenibacillus polymyxa TaxID=1406 RepID=UPI0005E5C8F5|nr:nucleoside triphosphate pyrophosphohydrolase [Paenibacillus polymyxa]KJD38688.1 phosphoribosyl-ATP pyrophosphohydrolase [Paenibacillus polymyxa]MBY7740167.1 nucleoside triphosphate pyrophosphohydrolase [Paenibacillus polymyxa]